MKQLHVRVYVDGKRHHVGRYGTEEEAQTARDKFMADHKISRSRKKHQPTGLSTDNMKEYHRQYWKNYQIKRVEREFDADRTVSDGWKDKANTSLNSILNSPKYNIAKEIKQ
jgi:hypothetical protein